MCFITKIIDFRFYIKNYEADTNKNNLKEKIEKNRYQYKTQGNKESMLKLLFYQQKLKELNDQNQETNFKIKEICK